MLAICVVEKQVYVRHAWRLFWRNGLAVDARMRPHPSHMMDLVWPCSMPCTGLAEQNLASVLHPPSILQTPLRDTKGPFIADKGAFFLLIQKQGSARAIAWNFCRSRQESTLLRSSLPMELTGGLFLSISRPRPRTVKHPLKEPPQILPGRPLRQLTTTPTLDHSRRPTTQFPFLPLSRYPLILRLRRSPSATMVTPRIPVALTPTRTTALSTTTLLARTQVRNATFIARPRRPYTFTQLVTLSDGSSYTMRTTSPLPIYRATKDTRNTLLWQPSEKSLRNVELDEAGKLAAFRERYGRAYDLGTSEEGEAEDGYADLITGYAPAQDASMKDSGPKKQAKKRK